MEEKERPAWINENGQIHEIEAARDFLRRREMKCVDGAFFTKQGRIHDEQGLRREIYFMLMNYVSTNIPRKVERILEVMRLESYQMELPHWEDRLHVANGTVFLDGDFVPKTEYCRYRLQVAYDPLGAPPQLQWMAFLEDLLEPEDILTLQEYMGYCLIPTTRAQKMLIITGRGGEGKSRIGVVMKAILGSNMSVGSIAKLETSPFARADLQHLLVLVDDDLKMEALSQTNNIKAIVTAELPMDLERKGIQSYQGVLHARLMAFGNGSLRSLYDRSYGFFRRQIILSTKEKDPHRKDDPYLGDKLVKEKDGIFLWCMEGLQRLRRNDFRFTISDKAQRNITESMSEGNNVLDFLRSEGYVRFEPEAASTTKALYQVYRDWCCDNALQALAEKTFSNVLKENGTPFGLVHTTHVPIGHGKQARGYRGVRTLCRF